MILTDHLGLRKPELTDPADIRDINNNMDILDTALPDAIETHNDSPTSHPDKVPFVHDSGGVRVLRNVAPKGFTSTKNGAIKIELPFAFDDVQIDLKIKGNELTGNTAFELHLAGYSYSDSNSWRWGVTSAILYAKDKTIVDKVIFGYDGEKACIVIGTVKSYYYLNLEIPEVLVFIGKESVTLNGWDMSLIPDMSGITNIVECAVEFAGIASGYWTPVLIGGNGGQAELSVAEGKWLKIGGLTRIEGLIKLQSVGDLNGNVVIQGLPFAIPARNIISGFVMPVNIVGIVNSATPLTDNQIPKLYSIASNLYLKAVDNNLVITKNFIRSDLQSGTTMSFILEWQED